jgi:drug/metabolite transporter (DMT)-like permease
MCITPTLGNMPNRRRPLRALALAGLLWGTTVPATKLALGTFDPGWLAVARFVLAGLPLLWWSRRQLRSAISPGVLGWGALGYGGVVALQTSGLAATSVTHAALLVGAVPAMVALIALALGRGTAAPRAWMGFALALLGVALVASDGGAASSRGDLLVVASVVLSAASTVAQAGLLRGRDPVAVTAVQFAISAVVTVPPAVLHDGRPELHGGSGGLFALLLLAIGGTLAPFTLFAWGQSRTTPEVAGAFLNLEPVVGAGAGALAFGDPFGRLQLVGGAAVLGGIALSALPSGVWRRAAGLGAFLGRPPVAAARASRAQPSAAGAVAGGLGGTAELRSAVVVGHRDLAGLGLLGDRDAERQDPVGVGGLDPRGVEPVPQRQLADERPCGAFARQPLHLVRPRRALGTNGEDPAVEADVDRPRVHPRKVAQQHVVIPGPEDVHRHGPHRGAHVGGRAEHALREPVEVTEWVETRHHRDHLLIRRSVTTCFATGHVPGDAVVVTPARDTSGLALSARECQR